MVIPLAALWALLPTDFIAGFSHFITSTVTTLVMELPHSRFIEHEADQVGLILAAKVFLYTDTESRTEIISVVGRQKTLNTCGMYNYSLILAGVFRCPSLSNVVGENVANWDDSWAWHGRTSTRMVIHPSKS